MPEWKDYCYLWKETQSSMGQDLAIRCSYHLIYGKFRLYTKGSSPHSSHVAKALLHQETHFHSTKRYHFHPFLWLNKKIEEYNLFVLMDGFKGDTKEQRNLARKESNKMKIKQHKTNIKPLSLCNLFKLALLYLSTLGQF